MDYSEMVGLYQKLESTTKNLEMAQILADFLRKIPEDNIHDCVLLALGRVFPSWSDKDIGVASRLMVQSIKKATGLPEDEITNYWKESGDLGTAAEKAVQKRTQMSLSSSKITVGKLVENIKKMASFEGAGTIEKKTDLVAELLASSRPEEAKYIARTILGVLRVGVGEGIMKDAISKAFGVEKKIIERAYYLCSDFGEVALTVKKKGSKGLERFGISIGRPIKVMLAQKADSIEHGFERVGKPCAIEYKYDGLRVQIHRKDGEILVFTRRLENVTKQFPEIVSAAEKCIKSVEFIVEGEAIGYDPATGEHIPFQKISRRIKRKYDIMEMSKQIPVETKLFDILYFEGEVQMGNRFRERRRILEKIVEPREKSMVLAKQLVTSDIGKASKFYSESLESGEEGVMMKNLDARYKPGSRVGYMVKLKPENDPLDLVIVGAEWGEGKRASWLSSFLLACYDKEKGKFLTIGKMATGLTDEQFREITKRLQSIIVSEKGRNVELRPEIVVEIGYQEIQKSPKYESGFALRFPRLIRFREDKSPEEAQTLEDIRSVMRKDKKS